MSAEILFAGATLPSGNVADILVRDGRIASIGTGLTSAHAEIVDVVGLHALPGLVDLHTHLREPGFEESETVLSGTQAAAAGGFTTVFAMANTNPVADTPGVVEQVWQRGRDTGYATVRPIGAVTVGLDGLTLADIGGMAASRANVGVFSDDGKCVSDPLVMLRALEYVAAFDGVVAQHAQEPRLTFGAQMNDGAVSARLGLAGWPTVAEESIIARDVLLAEYTGSRLHVCHVSTSGSVEIVRAAKSRGVRVTAEVTPHHLLLTDENAIGYDARFKVNPPLRSAADVRALREGLADGTIDIVATDHAPHPLESKECEWGDAAFGMVGLETALSIVYLTMVETGLMNWADVARAMSETPAKIGGVADVAGRLEVGCVADVTFVDASARDTWQVANLAGKSINSPYLGLDLPVRVVHTLRNGYFTMRDSRVLEAEVVARSARDSELQGEAHG